MMHLVALAYSNLPPAKFVAFALSDYQHTNQFLYLADRLQFHKSDIRYFWLEDNRLPLRLLTYYFGGKQLTLDEFI